MLTAIVVRSADIVKFLRLLTLRKRPQLGILILEKMAVFPVRPPRGIIMSSEFSCTVALRGKITRFVIKRRGSEQHGIDVFGYHAILCALHLKWGHSLRVSGIEHWHQLFVKFPRTPIGAVKIIFVKLFSESIEIHTSDLLYSSN